MALMVSCITSSQMKLSYSKGDRMREAKSLYALTEIAHFFKSFFFPFLVSVVFIVNIFVVISYLPQRYIHKHSKRCDNVNLQ